MAAYALALDSKLALQMKARTYAEFVQSTTLNRKLLALRLDEVRLLPALQWFLAGYPDVLHWVVVVAEDAPDTTVVLPLLARLAACSPRLDLHIICDGDGTDELGAWLEESGVADVLADADLPLLLIFDEEWQLQEQWGPFPQTLEPYFEAWLERHPEYETLSEDETFYAQATHSRANDTPAEARPEGEAAPEAGDAGENEDEHEDEDGTTQTEESTLSAEYVALLESLAWEMRIWFNSTLDSASTREICDLLRALLDDDSGDDDSSDDESSDDSPDEHGGDASRRNAGSRDAANA